MEVREGPAEGFELDGAQIPVEHVAEVVGVPQGAEHGHEPGAGWGRSGVDGLGRPHDGYSCPKALEVLGIVHSWLTWTWTWTYLKFRSVASHGLEMARVYYSDVVCCWTCTNNDNRRFWD